MPQEENKGIGNQAMDAVIDVRNELIVQSANLYLLVRRILLSSLGAAALTVDEASDLMAKLVERGELAEADMHQIVSDLRAQSAQREAGTAKVRAEIAQKAGASLEESVETILTRLNVPNKHDIDELSRKISNLNEKVTTLKSPRNPTH